LTKRGKPKKDPVPRDKGTRESIMHRTMLVGDGDPSLSTCALDIHFARKLITPEQHRSGTKFAHLREANFGKVYSQSSLSKMLIGGNKYQTSTTSEPTRREIFNHRYYREANNYLIKNGGANILRTVIDIVGYDQRPQYLENIYQPINKIVLDQFRKGLDLLCIFFTTPFRKMVGK
tara:strand:- start:2 stop:529 length:528 start_codon:yes stop_codon:yes gene_type:complete